MKRLPSLDALRAFECVARHMSFTKAAEELHVTQSALSHRIGALERELDVVLFRRLTRRLELTSAGEVLQGGMRRALEEIVRSTTEMHRAHAARPLTVSVLPSFAMRWLIPRLARFKALHPAIEVRVLAEPGISNLRSGAADLALRFGRGRYPDLHVTKLMPDSLFPVCSPALMKQVGRIAAPAEIARYPLLFDHEAENDTSGTGWASWLKQVGAPDVPCKEGLRFNRADLMLEAAASGLGLALARRSLALGDLATGRLVRALPHEVPTQYDYYFVCLPESADLPGVVAFRDWLLAEALQTGQEPQGRSALRVVQGARTGTGPALSATLP